MAIANSDYVPDESFPGISTGAHTNAPGSQGITAPATAGPVLASPAVNPAGIADGAGLGRITVPVHSGDTSGMADDNPAHASAIMPGPEQDYVSDGPKPNRTDHWSRYPWQNGG